MNLPLTHANDSLPASTRWPTLSPSIPPKLISLLKVLHATVHVKFIVGGITCVLESIIGVKQGDILGPILFVFYMAAVMITFRRMHKYNLCVYRTKEDFTLTGRSHTARGTEFAVSDSLYAGDSAVFFCSRSIVEKMVP